MKKLFLLFIMTFLPLLLSSADYFDVKINGIYYRLNNNSKEATVTMGCQYGSIEPYRIDSYTGDVVIPEYIIHNGISYTVTSIDGEIRGLEVVSSYGAFAGDKDLQSITIPKTIKVIGLNAFQGCTSLKAVYISDLTAWCNIAFGLHDRYDSYFPQANPLYCAHQLYVNGNKVSNLVIPEDVTNIGSGAFIGCDISSVTLGKNISSIGFKAFDGCSNLNTVYSYSPSISTYHSFIEHNNKTLHIRKRYYEHYLGDNLGDEGVDYYSSNEWKSFGKVEYIDGIDFNLVYVVDGKKYKTIIMEVGESIIPLKAPSKEGYSFSGWSEIPKTMPANDITITGSFSPNTYKLTYMVDGNVYKVCNIKCDEAIIPEAFPTKKGMTFSGWSNIPSIMPAKDVIVSGTFSWSKVVIDNIIYQVVDNEKDYATVIGNDHASKELIIPLSIELDGYNYHIVSISNNAFQNNTSIISVSIPETVIVIGENAFQGCSGLTSISIPNSVGSIGNYAFSGCSGLTSITIPASVGSIGNYAFSGCSGLTSITIPSSVRGIGDYAFSGCSGLTSITIPSSVRGIGDYAFSGCTSIMSVKSYISEPFNVTGLFANETYRQGTLYVPKGTKDLYIRYDGWREFLNIEEMGDEPAPNGQCATPTITFMGKKFVYECETPGAEFESILTSEEKSTGNEFVMENKTVKYTLTVYATAEAYDRSEPATISFVIDKCDVNQDGNVDVADIATIIDRMAGK